MLPLRRRTLFDTPPATPTLPNIAGLQLWLKADGALWQDAARTTPAVVDGDPVGAWDDASGNALHATQATGSRRPTLKLAVQHGRAVLRFDGLDDFLTTDSFQSFPSKRGTLFAAFRNWTPGTRLLSTCNPSVAAGKWIWYSTRSGSAFKWYDGVSNFLAPSGDTDAFFCQTVVRSADTTLNVYTDGGLLATLTISTTQPLASVLGVGGDQTLVSEIGGDIGEVLVYNSALPATDRQAIEAYLRARWRTL